VALNQQENTYFSKERRLRIMNHEPGSFVHKGIISEAGSVEFVTGKGS
jgi:hypothetical protein